MSVEYKFSSIVSHMRLEVRAIPSEQTRFLVESENTLQCDTCERLERVTKKRIRGTPCSCGVGSFGVTYHLVDIGDFNAVGSCRCEFFDFTLRPKLEKLTKDDRLYMSCDEKWSHRCKHVRAARDYALDIQLEAYNNWLKSRINMKG